MALAGSSGARATSSRRPFRPPIFLLIVFATELALAAPPLSPRLDDVVKSEVAQGFSGAVLIARGDEILLDRGYGKAGGMSVRARSRFWIASSGKPFASAAILKCADRGWLTLDDAMVRFFPAAPPDKAGITIRQLLAHLSGLDQTYAAEGASGRDDAVRRILSRPAIDAPGSRFHYSNDNYQLAAAIVEIASGSDYKEFVTQELFRPAGLTDTGFAGSAGARRVLPGNERMPARLATSSWGMEGVYSTTGDLLRWYRALTTGRILSAASVAALFAPMASIQEGYTALGWFLGKTDRGNARIFVRGNEDWGPNSLLYAYPDSGTVVIILTHAGDASDDVSWSRRILGKLERSLGL